MGSIKANKIILMVFASLVLSFSAYALTVFYGTPWEKQKHEKNMEQYLEKKYKSNFNISKVTYNLLSETYQGYAYPTGHSNLIFIIEEDVESIAGYSDNYPKVMRDRMVK